ncbi:MAG: helix-turn-helix transcriptional regulator [Chloroflexota bacterium]
MKVEDHKTALNAERLRMWRERYGWSQRELARRCGLGEAQVNKYENGQTDPSAKYLKAMAEQLDVSTDYLLGLTDHPRGSYGDTLTAEESKLIDAYAAGDNAAVLEMIAQRLRQSEK